MYRAKARFTSGRTLNIENIEDIETMTSETIGIVFTDGGKAVVPLRNVEYIVFGNDAAKVEQSLTAENAELKRLLRLAAGDLNQIKRCSTCKNMYADCYPRCIDDCFFEWEHAAEVEKLLGGENPDKPNQEE